jgi:hypothetical protein
MGVTIVYQFFRLTGSTGFAVSGAVKNDLLIFGQ